MYLRKYFKQIKMKSNIEKVFFKKIPNIFHYCDLTNPIVLCLQKKDFKKVIITATKGPYV